MLFFPLFVTGLVRYETFDTENSYPLSLVPSSIRVIPLSDLTLFPSPLADRVKFPDSVWSEIFE